MQQSDEKPKRSIADPIPGKPERGYGELLRPLYGPVKENWLLTVATIISGFGKFMLPLIIFYSGKVIIDTLSNGDLGSEEKYEILFLWSMVGFGTIIACAVTTYFRSVFGHKLMARIQHLLRHRLFYHLQHLGMDFFAKHPRRGSGLTGEF